MAIKEKVHIPIEDLINDSVIISKITIDNFAHIEKGDVICEYETSKAVFPLISPESGYIELKFIDKDEVKAGEVFALIHDNLDHLNIHKQNSAVKKREESFSNSSANNRVPSFTKKAIELMKKHDLSEEIFHGKDLVKEADVLLHMNALSDYKKNKPAEISLHRSFLIPTDTKVVELPSQKVMEIQALTNNQNMITSNFCVKVKLPANFFNREQTTAFDNLKNNLTPLILKYLYTLLKKFKEFNAFYHDNCIHYYNYINIGYALDLDKGLKVANLGDLGKKTCSEIISIIFDCVSKYIREGFSIKDLSGTTFTVTDVSAEDVLFFSPLINKFQSAVLGISSIDSDNMSFLLNLVFDHRVTEGKKAAQFLKELKNEIESKTHSEEFINQFN